MAEEIMPFNKLFPVKAMTASLVERRGLAWALANRAYRKHNPCLLDALYYMFKPVEYIKPVLLSFDEEGRLMGADFGDFAVGFNEDTGWYDYKVGNIDKYGAGFEKYLGLLVGVRNEDGVCRTLMTAVLSYEEDRSELTFDGVRALFTVAALLVQSIRVRAPPLPEIPAEKPTVKPVPVVPPAEKMPEIGAVASMIGFIAHKYKLSIDEVIEKKSAKSPGRVIFGEMLKQIEKGEADDIVKLAPR